MMKGSVGCLTHFGKHIPLVDDEIFNSQLNLSSSTEVYAFQNVLNSQLNLSSSTDVYAFKMCSTAN